MTGLDIVMACLLTALQCDVDIFNPPEGTVGPQIINICPEGFPATGTIEYSHILTDAEGKQIAVILSCGAGT